MQEKYHVIDNDERYYVIIKCTKSQLIEYKESGLLACELICLSKYFNENRIKHTVIYNKCNSEQRQVIDEQLDVILPKAIENKLFISNEEIDNLLFMSEERRNELFW